MVGPQQKSSWQTPQTSLFLILKAAHSPFGAYEKEHEISNRIADGERRRVICEGERVLYHEQT